MTVNTIILMSAGLVIAFVAGLLVGTGYTTHSVDRSLRLLAQRRRLLNEREQAVEAALADHYVCLNYNRPRPGSPTRPRAVAGKPGLLLTSAADRDQCN